MARPDFDRYSPSEFRNLQNLPKKEILDDLTRRGAIEKRPTKAKQSDTRWDRKVRIVPRKDSGEHARTGWFYMKIDGFPVFTTHIRMDIQFPCASELETNPDDWWKHSKMAELLATEVESAQCFFIGLKVRAILRVLAVPALYAAIQHEAGFDGFKIFTDLLKNEGWMGACRLTMGYLRNKELLAKSLLRVITMLGDVEESEKAKEIGVEIERRVQLCTEWEPGKPEWRIMKPSTFEPISGDFKIELQRFIEPNEPRGIVIALLLVLFLDKFCLMQRFRSRYLVPANKIEQSLSPKPPKIIVPEQAK